MKMIVVCDKVANTIKEVPMKVRKSLRSLKQKPGSQVVRRGGKVYVINKRDPRFKARQG
jgi:large subunit ribosomal protein L36